MPFYDYRCGKCNEIVEFEKPIDAPHPKWHYGREDCMGPLEQVVHAPAIQFKGPGFYVNDYGKGTT